MGNYGLTLEEPFPKCMFWTGAAIGILILTLIVCYP